MFLIVLLRLDWPREVARAQALVGGQSFVGERPDVGPHSTAGDLGDEDGDSIKAPLLVSSK